MNPNRLLNRAGGLRPQKNTQTANQHNSQRNIETEYLNGDLQVGFQLLETPGTLPTMIC